MGVVAHCSLESVFFRRCHGILRISEDWGPLCIGIAPWLVCGCLYMCTTFVPHTGYHWLTPFIFSNTKLILACCRYHSGVGLRVFGHWSQSTVVDSLPILCLGSFLPGIATSRKPCFVNHPLFFLCYLLLCIYFLSPPRLNSFKKADTFVMWLCVAQLLSP